MIMGNILVHGVFGVVGMGVVMLGFAVAMRMRVNNNLPAAFAFAADFGLDFTDAAAFGTILFLSA